MSQYTNSDRILDAAFKSAAANLTVEFDDLAWADLSHQLDQVPAAVSQNPRINWLKNIHLNSILIVSSFIILASILYIINKTPAVNTKAPEESVSHPPPIADSLENSVGIDSIVKEKVYPVLTYPERKRTKQETPTQIKLTVKKDSLAPAEPILNDTLAVDSLEHFIFWN